MRASLQWNCHARPRRVQYFVISDITRSLRIGWVRWDFYFEYIIYLQRKEKKKKKFKKNLNNSVFLISSSLSILFFQFDWFSFLFSYFSLPPKMVVSDLINSKSLFPRLALLLRLAAFNLLQLPAPDVVDQAMDAEATFFACGNLLMGYVC